MDKKTKTLAHGPLHKEVKQLEDLAAGFAKIQRSTAAFAGPRDDYHGKRLPGKDWKKRQARKRMQRRSRQKNRP